MTVHRSQARVGTALVWAILGLFVLPMAGEGQEGAVAVRVHMPGGDLSPALTIVEDEGFAAVPARELNRLGWSVSPTDEGIVANWQGAAPTVEVRAGTPFLSWGSDGVQLAEAPYEASGELYLPLQFFIDILTWKMPEVFGYDSDSRTLVVRGGLSDSGPATDPIRVVVIDPGHGGRDPGARGAGGTLEKDVALAIGRALARDLEEDPATRVYLTRDTDTLIPIWKRGELATAWKGEHPGVFVSIHANALPGSAATRGFETYFLSEARTDHERRVAALENAAQEFEVEGDGPNEGSDLSFILTELRNLDHQHWSALLAELIQDKMDQVHPGPNRGVKQGPLAVITNALMPAVLVEVGFLTHGGEERLLTQNTFQENTARAIAAAVREFFLRYPGGAAPSVPAVGSRP